MLLGGSSSHIGQGISIMCGRDHYGIDLLSLTEWPSAYSSAQIRACIVGCACVHHWRDRKSDLFAALFIIFPQK